MPKFTYLGVEEASDPEGTEAFGIYFPVGEAVDVAEDRPRVIAKLSNHPHFHAGDAAPKQNATKRGRRPKPESGEEPAAEQGEASE